ncbi:hypothetical protein NDU88_004552 [Pleurodeles waltl]|uniref:Uncharacterized protein n=1 Tax=Pleurodeles waltl TaxID=8319 RepID=A0AAV7SJ58_PLEWA|nr:hypothetical protein NDU88_004552 [Pleurodeles waltl]
MLSEPLVGGALARIVKGDNVERAGQEAGGSPSSYGEVKRRLVVHPFGRSVGSVGWKRDAGVIGRAVNIRERASFFLSFRHSVSQRPSSAVEDARSSAAHSFQRTRSIPHILWAGIPCQLILASRLYFRPGLLAI